jgi:dTDP-4-dehydrorhamnose reductase
MKVMVVGAHGQVGSCLTAQLTERDDVELLAVDRDTLDITDRAAVVEAVNQFNPDVIINAAAHTAVDRAEQEIELSYAINRDGPMYLAQAAHESDAAILHISTDYVFAGDKEGIYQEDEQPDPQGVYGQSKLAGEIAVSEECARHIILRTAWVFGETGNNFVKTMIRLAKSRDSLGIVGDQFGGPTYAGDIASALITIADQIYTKGADFSDFGVYHFSGLPHVSWCQFANQIFTKAKDANVIANIPVVTSLTTAEYPTPAKRPANSKLDTSKIIHAFAIPASDWNKALDNIQAYSE